ncbi:hypothetical protein K438DRAFT_1858117 [Mycena galopus ATCC 62051]|nr:hypothetical protein K438DRAFT_1858117 [Mycena galopus ATCC 62051]
MAAGQTAIHHAPCFQHVATPIQLVARRPAMIVQGSVSNRTQAQWSHSPEKMMLPCCHVSRPPSTMPRARACPLNSPSDCSKHRVRCRCQVPSPRRPRHVRALRTADQRSRTASWMCALRGTS